MTKETLDQWSSKLLGTAGAPSILSKVIHFALFGLCTYCAILRGVLFGFGLALYTHLSVPAVIAGTTCILAAVILTHVERSTNKEITP